MIFQIIIILNSVLYFLDSAFLGFIKSIRVFNIEINFGSLTIIYITISAIFIIEFIIYERIIKRELKVYRRLRD